MWKLLKMQRNKLRKKVSWKFFIKCLIELFTLPTTISHSQLDLFFFYSFAFSFSITFYSLAIRNIRLHFMRRLVPYGVKYTHFNFDLAIEFSLRAFSPMLFFFARIEYFVWYLLADCLMFTHFAFDIFSILK